MLNTANALVLPPVPHGPDRQGAVRFLTNIVRDPLGAMPASAYDEPMTRLRILGQDIGIICDPDTIHELLVRRPADFPKTRIDDSVFQPAVGNGLLTAKGDDWKWKRSLVAPTFAPSRLANCVADMAAPFADLVADWRQVGGPSAVTISQAMTTATFEVVCRTLFASRNEIGGPALAGAIDDYLRPISWVIGLTTMNLPGWLPYPGSRKLRRARNTMRSIVGGVVEGRRSSGETADDFCGFLMAARDPESGRSLDDEDVIDMLLTLIAAGHETSANGLTWALYCLARQPEIQERLANEARSAMDCGHVRPDRMDTLPLTEAFLKETMRLFPPVPLLARQNRNCETLAGHTFPSGSTLFIPVYAIHRHRRLWDMPHAFRLERFLPGSGPPAKMAYLPFGAGPRICVGGAFAMLEMKVALAQMLVGAKFRISGETQCDPVHRVTLRPRAGLSLTVVPV